MPIPSLNAPIEDSLEVATELDAITTAIAALPATPLEADLPAIVQIVADLKDTATSLQAIVAQILTTLSTTRVSQ